MKFKFVGDAQGDGPAQVSAFGSVFPKGQAVEVEGPNVIEKLRGNSHFAEVRRKNGQNKSPDPE